MNIQQEFSSLTDDLVKNDLFFLVQDLVFQESNKTCETCLIIDQDSKPNQKLIEQINELLKENELLRSEGYSKDKEQLIQQLQQSHNENEQLIDSFNKISNKVEFITKSIQEIEQKRRSDIQELRQQHEKEEDEYLMEINELEKNIKFQERKSKMLQNEVEKLKKQNEQFRTKFDQLDQIFFSKFNMTNIQQIKVSQKNKKKNCQQRINESFQGDISPNQKEIGKRVTRGKKFKQATNEDDSDESSSKSIVESEEQQDKSEDYDPNEDKTKKQRGKENVEMQQQKKVKLEKVGQKQILQELTNNSIEHDIFN